MGAPRTYTVGLPVALTVHDNGTVTVEVDITEAVDGVREYNPEFVTMYDQDGQIIEVSEAQLETDAEAIEAFIERYYAGTDPLPLTPRQQP